jgi:hypothetical protein
MALKEMTPVRGLWAVAERPDGTRVPFMPYPTPIFSEDQLLGAVNILIYMTDAAQTQASRARGSPARSTTTPLRRSNGLPWDDD